MKLQNVLLIVALLTSTAFAQTQKSIPEGAVPIVQRLVVPTDAGVVVLSPLAQIFEAIESLDNSPQNQEQLDAFKILLHEHAKILNTSLNEDTKTSYLSDFNGLTPLAFAIYKNNRSAIVALLDNAAEPTQRFKHPSGFEMLPATYVLYQCSEIGLTEFRSRNVDLALNEMIPTDLAPLNTAKRKLPAYEFAKKRIADLTSGMGSMSINFQMEVLRERCNWFKENLAELEFIAKNPNVSDQLQEEPTPAQLMNEIRVLKKEIGILRNRVKTLEVKDARGY